MKKLFVLLIAVTMLAGCVAPAQQPVATAAPTAQPETSPTNAAEPQAEGAPTAALSAIQLYIKQKTVTIETEQVTLIIINSSDQSYTYDYVQKLERKNDDGTWETVPLTTEAVSMALMTIGAGETQEQVFDFANHFEPLTHGTYRIVKTFVDESGVAADAYCEFDAM